ncbi:hypothetical protein PMAYCL1PPCAC_16843, partial [Pristionchus mayeri]
RDKSTYLSKASKVDRGEGLVRRPLLHSTRAAYYSLRDHVQTSLGKGMHDRGRDTANCNPQSTTIGREDAG